MHSLLTTTAALSLLSPVPRLQSLYELCMLQVASVSLLDPLYLPEVANIVIANKSEHNGLRPVTSGVIRGVALFGD